MKYKIVQAATITDLEIGVTKMIAEGYEPYCNMKILPHKNVTHFYQPMIKDQYAELG